MYQMFFGTQKLENQAPNVNIMFILPKWDKVTLSSPKNLNRHCGFQNFIFAQTKKINKINLNEHFLEPLSKILNIIEFS